MKRPNLELRAKHAMRGICPLALVLIAICLGDRRQRASADSALLSLRQWLFLTGGSRVDTTGPRWKSL